MLPVYCVTHVPGLYPERQGVGPFGDEARLVRFFSKEWHDGDMPDLQAELVPEAYRAHLESLRSLLPEGAIRLSEINLHDGLIREVVCRGTELHVVVRAGDLQVGYFDVRIEYSSAIVSQDALSFLERAIGRRDVEVLYDEIDVVEGGGWKHSVLFCPYHEIAVRFDAVELSVTNVSSRFEGAA